MYHQQLFIQITDLIIHPWEMENAKYKVQINENRKREYVLCKVQSKTQNTKFKFEPMTTTTLLFLILSIFLIREY